MQKFYQLFFISVEKFSFLCISTKRKEILNNLGDLDGIGETQIKSIENFFYLQNILPKL